MSGVFSCFNYAQNLFFRALSLAIIMCPLLTCAQLSDALKRESQHEHRWFIFIGGSTNMPVWTSCRGNQYQGLPSPLYLHQISAGTRFMEAALGVLKIVVLPNMTTISVKKFPTDVQLFSTNKLFFPDKLSPEELSSVILQSVRNLTDSPDPLILELQPSLNSIFSDAYLTRYSDPPVVLCLVRQPQDAKLRLYRLTQQLSEIGDKMRQLTDHTSVLPTTLSVMDDVGVFEAVWRNSILKPFNIEPLKINVWKSFSTVELVFAEEFPFGEWAEVIAGKTLGGGGSSDNDFNSLLHRDEATTQ